MPELIVKLGDNVVQKYFFITEQMSVGRAPENEIVIENLAVSRHHATIHFEDDRYLLEDLGSSNGTYVNGVRVRKTEILDRDVIAIGKHKLYFYDQRSADAQRRPQLVDADRTMLVMPQQMTELEAVLTVVRGRPQGHVFKIGKGRMIVGRGSDCDVRLSDWFVSKHHAELIGEDYGFSIRDLNSWRHTLVNGMVIQQTRLANGDTIQLGPNVELSFAIQEQQPSSKNNGRTPVELAPERPADSQFPVQPAEGDKKLPPTSLLDWEAVHGAMSGDVGPEDGAAVTGNEFDLESLVENPNGLEPERDSTPPEAQSVADGAAQPEPYADLFAQPDAFAAPEDAGSELLEAEAANQRSTGERERVAAEMLEFFGVPAAGEIELDPNDMEDSTDRMTVPDALPVLDVAQDQSGAESEIAVAPGETLDNAARLTNDEQAADLCGVTPAEGPPAKNHVRSYEYPVDHLVEQIAVCSVERAVVCTGEENVERRASRLRDAAGSETDLEAEIQLWERALENKSPLIRRQAARKLKQLTGKDYEY